jgi:hypothetical protein
MSASTLLLPMLPVIELVLVFFGDSEDYLCSLRTILC